MAQLGTEYEFAQRIAALEAQSRAQATSPILLNASTGQDGGLGLTTDINGLHLFNPAGVEDITLSTADGSANFNGNVNVNGNLSVPNGSITNAALLNPVQYGSVGTSEGSFAIDTTHRKRAVATITVPAGYSQATVLTVANVNGNNTTAGTDHMYVQAYAGAGVGGASTASVLATDFTSASASAINTFTGLSGGTIEVGSYVYCSTGPWTSSVYNLANVNAIVWFTR